MIRWILAEENGRCAACNSIYYIDDLVSVRDDESVIARDCCAGTGYSALVQFMPPRSEASDSCATCFIIHATNQSECE